MPVKFWRALAGNPARFGETEMFSIGDRVRFETHSNLGVREDIVRDKVEIVITREPYARNETVAALILTEFSWCRESDVLEIVERA